MSVASSQHSHAVAAPAVVSQPGVPLLDIPRAHRPIHEQIVAAIERVCQSGRFVNGPECGSLEKNMAACCQTAHAVGCASGSDALLLALMACDVTTDDEVLMPSYTFFATASAAWRLGAKPVFVDIEPETFNLDAAALDALVTPRTKAIIPVHLFGQCAEMDAINQVAQRHKLHVIEDAAQAVGAELAGRRAGGLAHVGCFSFYPTKNLGALGDGGMLTTNDEGLAQRLRRLAAHGMHPRYYHDEVGINSRLDTLQAAALGVKLPYLEAWTADRATNANRYGELFAARKLDTVLTLPPTAAHRRHVWNQYVVRVPDGRRDALRSWLAERKIGTEIYYPVPLHLQRCFSPLGYGPGSLPVSEQAAHETLALPIFPELTPTEQRTVVEAIGQFFDTAKS